ncbi:MAG: efflux RND transporter periplasmic adaptor subunit [Flavobacteriales bacterium]|nr:efflux RND transporter periplasmic adaptor subunit [Flavobacteriales bacterium]MBK7287434.1 efflux RND transporter periplasmic adaptor subunit [Flavobacteriales bacterium]MBK9598044.1 efflux RND transporter periplasmic adaptor subunit [Flavobacteriales bacterium]QQS73476.1 MAG: efflux RND transporter periplasmic adaptor subunit [Flavobacteriales bacterium]HQV39705.1 efflux RND transporter periplasmic adaptor subunit [Flavobacteriales bacterium]
MKNENADQMIMLHEGLAKRTLMPSAIVLILFALVACGGGTTAPAADEHAHEAPGAHGPEVALTTEQIKAIGLVTGTMEKRGLSTSLKANGRLVLPPDKSAQVSVLAGGLVRGIPVREGQVVSKGQVLATVENMEFLQLQQDYLETSAELRALNADLKRQQDLHDERINATKTLERAEADADVARAKQAGMAAKLRVFGTDPARLSAQDISSTYSVRSPIAGTLQHIAITLGQFAEPNTPLFMVVDNSGLHIDLNLFEQDVARVHAGQKVVFGHAGEPVGQHSATIYAVNKAFERDQQAVLAHGKLDDNGEELMPGMYIEALIMTDSTSAWSLPNEAVVSNGDEHYIFVEAGPNTFKQVAVRIGASELGYTEVVPLEPVDPIARIVVKGAYYLLSELTKGTGEHDH